MFRNILVCVDGSAHAERALDEAIDLAQAERARLAILTAVLRPPPIGYGPAAAAAYALAGDLERESEAILRGAMDRVPADVPVTTILSQEPIGPAALHEIDRGGYDVVVMGSRGRGTIRSALLGSASHYVLHHSHVPVLIVHVDASAAPAVAQDAQSAVAA
jgi:nucleotide-binding universal stress UspA family protein